MLATSFDFLGQTAVEGEGWIEIEMYGTPHSRVLHLLIGSRGMGWVAHPNLLGSGLTQIHAFTQLQDCSADRHSSGRSHVFILFVGPSSMLSSRHVYVQGAAMEIENGAGAV